MNRRAEQAIEEQIALNVGMFGKAGKLPKQFGWVHEIHCQSENELFVAEVLNWRIQKLILHPDKKTSTGDQY